MKKKIISWKDLDKCRKLLVKYKGHIDCIVCILRGGAVPAVIASHILDVPIHYVEFKSYKGCSRSKLVQYNDYSIDSSIKGKRILLIDDIFDTGRTLDYALEIIRDKEPLSIDIFVLVTKDRAVLSEKVVPYSYAITCPGDNWCVLPWEK